MKALLDTQAFLWLRTGRLSKAARDAFVDTSDDIFLSLASVWEIVIKTNVHKLDPGVPTRELITRAVAAGIQILPIGLEHLLRLESLPKHHKDPFDRLLIAQALHENLKVIGSDTIFDKYGVSRIW